VLVISRELAVQLRRDVKPRLDEQGVKLFLVSIGTWEKSQKFAEATGFPAENLFVDPENSTYSAIGLNKGVRQTFFSLEVCILSAACRQHGDAEQTGSSAQTPLAIKKRMDEGRTGDLKDVLEKWQPWNPPKLDQVRTAQ
jgi:hypothetical protein